MKNLRLGVKMALGFGVLVVIACILGGVGILNMKIVEGDTVRLAVEHVPEVALANEVERASLLSMFEIRGYGLTGEGAYLERGRKNLAQMESQLKAALDHAGQYSSLSQIKENLDLAGAKVNEYRQLIEQTVAKNNDIDRNRKAMDEFAGRFIKGISNFLEDQNFALGKELSDGAEGALIYERVKKINFVNDVIALGNTVREENWKAQATRDTKILQETMKHFGTVDRKLDEIKAITLEAEDLKKIPEIKGAAEGYKRAMEEYLVNSSALQEIGRKRDDLAKQILATAVKTAKSGMDQTRSIADKTVTSLSRSTTTMLIGLLLALFLGTGLAILITRSITRPIRNIIQGLTESSGQVASASFQVSSASQSLAEGSSEQASAIEETSSSLEEMSSMTKQNAGNALQAKQKMGETKGIVEKVNQHMNEMAMAIGEITKSSEETGKIIRTIDEIAFQTNLLALNAAVEAARAGDAGAGFAVVAGEVRNLAMRAADAAKNTATLIENTIRSVKKGNELTQATQSAFKRNVEIAGQVGGLVDEIAAACQEQASGIEHVNRAVAEMDEVVQQVAANAEESASASEEMNAQAEQMKGFVGRLVSLVGGSATAAHGASVMVDTLQTPTSPGTLRESGGQVIAAQRRKSLAAPSGRELNPDRVIPFGDKEGFQDF